MQEKIGNKNIKEDLKVNEMLGLENRSNESSID